MEKHKYMVLVESIQEDLDCWLDQGATIEDLRKGTEARIEQCMEEWGSDFIGDYKTALEVRIPKLTYYYNVLQALQHFEWEQENKITVEALMQDYALYCGQQAIDHERPTDPMDYLVYYMESSEQPPKAVCIEFLSNFFGEESIGHWLGNIVWEEDEDGEA